MKHQDALDESFEQKQAYFAGIVDASMKPVVGVVGDGMASVTWDHTYADPRLCIVFPSYLTEHGTLVPAKSITLEDAHCIEALKDICEMALLQDRNLVAARKELVD